MQIFAGVRWRGGVKWEWGGRKWRLSLHSFTVFRTFYIHGHTTAFRWYNSQWPLAYFKVIGLFHIKFLKNGVWYGKSYYRQLIGYTSFRLVPLLMTLKYIWRSFSLGCHFYVHFSYPWHALIRVARSPSNSWTSCTLIRGPTQPEVSLTVEIWAG